MDKMKSFLGTGWSFPPAFTKEGVILVSEYKDISESLYILLSTTPGERIMRPEYGCDLKRLIFEGITASSVGYVKETIRRAILFFEPRIDVEEIKISDADSQKGGVEILITYHVRGTNSRTNMVFPYYLNEGTNLAQPQ
jgi:uncharacterized protein